MSNGQRPLAHALNVAMNSADSDVELWRSQIGECIHQLITEALTDRADPDTVMTKKLLHSGGMIIVGAGMSRFETVADQVERAARRMLAQPRGVSGAVLTREGRR